MAVKDQDYGSGDVFVPKGAFPSIPDVGDGPKKPSVSDLGPAGTVDMVFGGPAFGGVRDNQGARMMDDKKPNFPSKLKPAANHLPENA